MAMPARVLFLAADALDRDLVLQWAGDGTLPTFQRLLDRAAWGMSENPPGLFVGAVWPSFWTSVSPARHARYCYEQLRPGSYEIVRVRPTDTHAPAFWNALSAAGRRVAVIDVPKTFVAEGFNGCHIVDWGTHDPDYPGPVTWPPSLAQELVSTYGRDVVGNCNTHGRAGEYQRLRDELLDRIARKRRMILDLLTRESWDVMLAVFSESHCVGHQCWHVHDSTHARHDATLAARIGDPMRDVYIAIDTAMGEIIARAGADTDVIVLGSHGMRSHYDATFLLDQMLWCVEHPHGISTPLRPPFAKRVWARTPHSVRRMFAPLKQRMKDRLDPNPLASRRFFPVPNNDAYGAIRLNLAGREPAGRVARHEFDAVCASLERDLLAFTNVDTGEPVARRVWRVDSVYAGPRMGHLPDLIVEWNRDAPIARVRSERTGEIAGVYTKCRTGDHSPDGIFFALGDGVAPGRVAHNVSIMDFGPTLAERVGVTLPDVDGRSFAPSVFRGASR